MVPTAKAVRSKYGEELYITNTIGNSLAFPITEKLAVSIVEELTKFYQLDKGDHDDLQEVS